MRRTLPLAALALFALASAAAAQSGDNVLLVVNEWSAESGRVAEHYARARAVPKEQILRIKVDAAADEVERRVFEDQIQTPISDWLRANSAQDRILFIVLTKGIPLRVQGTAGRAGTVASVDSELTLLYRRLAGSEVTLVGSIPNPYYVADGAVARAKPFSHQTHDVYLVTRLDGFTVDDVLRLIDRGAAPASGGKILLDQKGGFGDAGGDAWLKAAADWMTANGFGDRAVLETTSRPVGKESGVLGYYSWGSSDPAVTSRHVELGFEPGAIAAMFVSSDARTFKEPPADWKIGSWTDRAKFFAGSPQSLSGDLIRDGVTGVAGHVAEPYLDATIRPDVLFPAYLSGFNLAESYYLAMPYLSWQTVVVGDPLCASSPRKALQPSDIDKGIDAATELPALISLRRLKALTASGTAIEAARLLLRADARKAKGDTVGAQKALEEATALDTRLTAAHLQLAETYESNKEYDKAIERYRKTLAVAPSNTIALNNLAYCLAVRKGQPAEAIGYAERAYTLSRNAPAAADTLGWIQHLLGRDREAAQLLAQAAAGLPANAEVRLHAAVVYAAVGMPDAAARELAEAMRLDPSLEKSPEAVALRAKLKGPAKAPLDSSGNWSLGQISR